jgi:coproporphyrinogen III oxidase-like Fe-S oxidoreductase
MMTSLRTMWGCDKHILETNYKQQLQKIKTPLENQLKVGNLIDTGTNYKLAKHARFFADGIAAGLFV